MKKLHYLKFNLPIKSKEIKYPSPFSTSTSLLHLRMYHVEVLKFVFGAEAENPGPASARRSGPKVGRVSG